MTLTCANITNICHFHFAVFFFAALSVSGPA